MTGTSAIERAKALFRDLAVLPTEWAVAKHFERAEAETRAKAIEDAAQIADEFRCGGCGMDGKAGNAIRAIAKP